MYIHTGTSSSGTGICCSKYIKHLQEIQNNQKRIRYWQKVVIYLARVIDMIQELGKYVTILACKYL